MVTNTNGVTGTDGVVPIYDPNARFEVWKKSELYMGGPGANRYVPNAGDLVIDMDLGGLQYKVASVDQATLIPVLVEMTPVVSSGEFTDNDLLLGVGPGTPADTYRVYIDTSVTPFAVAVDERLFIRGSMAAYVKIFRGADLSNQGNIISHIYDTQGNILSDQIPLEVVQTLSGNISVKTVPVCYTTEQIPNSEILTLVAYSSAGGVVSKRQLLAENTSFIRSPSIGTKYITGISLDCPFLSTMDPTLIELPINVLLSGVNMVGVVHYSDGSTRRLPVDGTKFTLLGANAYLATVVGIEASVILRYNIDSSEIVYGSGSNGTDHFITKSYKLITEQEDGAYDVKLYGYPVWQDSVNGYRLRWFLYNGDRTVTYDVTDQVQVSPGSPAFNPLLYGTLQQITVGLNLASVNPSYKSYRHAQTIGITLWGPGTARTTNWTVQYSVNQNPPYGDNNQHATLKLINYNYNILNLASGFSTLNDWLNAVYYRTQPLIDQSRETAPPAPTHYRLRFGSFDQTFPIDQWNTDTVIENGLNDNDTLFIEFIYHTSLNDAQLAIAGMPVYVIPS